MDRKDNILNSLRRILSNESISARIYIIWGISVLIIFGFLGLYPVTKILISNLTLIDDLYTSNISMEENVEKLKKLKEKVDFVKDDIYLLDSFVPTEFRAQDYLVDISVISSKNGYFMDKVSFGENKEFSVVLNISLIGNGSPTDMIQGLESSAKLKRWSK